MPTTCVVVGCFNRHSKENPDSFYRFPTDTEKRHRWISFVSRQNADGTPWVPGDGDRLCSKHFISGKKSDSPCSPDFVPSVYPKAAEKSSTGGGLNRLARFERAKRRSAANEMERFEKEKEEERSFSTAQFALRGFRNDHMGYCKGSERRLLDTVEQVVESSCHPISSRSSTVEEEPLPSIPAEAGEDIVMFAL